MSLLWHRLDPWPENLCMTQAPPKRRKEKRKNKTTIDPSFKCLPGPGSVHTEVGLPLMSKAGDPRAPGTPEVGVYQSRTMFGCKQQTHEQKMA